MRFVIQRVKSASVVVDGLRVSSINSGLLVLVGFSPDEDEAFFEKAARNITGLRIFDDKNGRMNLSVLDIDGEILLVPQITLCASLCKGKRPSFDSAAKPGFAKEMFERFASVLKNINKKTCFGVFGADMEVSLVNDGPVTFVMDAP